MFDCRNLISNRVGSAIHKFEVTKLLFSLFRSSVFVSFLLLTRVLHGFYSGHWTSHLSVFGSSAEEGLLNIWDYEKVGRTGEYAELNSPPGLFFQHTGHRFESGCIWIT
ncbi:hypothetical protein Vadar_021115 [Vaccinium darrowii]|uniref:Uncharacterized protein n=1 Tax=Vaccinium darrowii TaxID=229202 RepID=A0ACB7XSQ3_9ERIC|nr:hypothetical protein Vadar_021115 [Vaccinium darrowii]